MDTIWTGTVEVLVEPGDLASDRTKAFVNIATWADSGAAFQKKISEYLATFNWRLVNVERASPFDQACDYSDDLRGMIERTSANPEAIILGTFYTFEDN